jgi:hypothetical protein
MSNIASAKLFHSLSTFFFGVIVLTIFIFLGIFGIYSWAQGSSNVGSVLAVFAFGAVFCFSFFHFFVLKRPDSIVKENGVLTGIYLLGLVKRKWRGAKIKISESESRFKPSTLVITRPDGRRIMRLSSTTYRFGDKNLIFDLG